MPFFTVIIPAYNRYESLKKAIDSVLSQTYKDFELIIVDDGSTDNTPSVKSIYKDEIIYIKQPNQGVSSARNTGIKKSNGLHIAFLDSDDQWLPDKLQEQYQYICNNNQIKIHQTEEIWIRNGLRVNPMKKHKKIQGYIFPESLDLCMISPSSVVIHRDLFSKYGLFDEDIPVCEDYDMWLRITCHEETGLIAKKLIKKYGGHESQLSKAYWGMDRFRIYSIIKILKTKEHKIRQEYHYLALKKAIAKCRILLNGALKRKNNEFANRIESTIRHLESENYNNINPDFLLQ